MVMAMSDTQNKAEIEYLLRQNVTISKSNVLIWMNSPDREIQGMAYNLLFEYSHRLDVPLEEETVNTFFINYLEQCMRDPIDSEHTHSRYMAGHALRAWFQQLWKKRNESAHVLARIREMLERICIEGDISTKDAIITSILEHLFVNSEIVEYFKEWNENTKLAKTYKEAVDLATTL